MSNLTHKTGAGDVMNPHLVLDNQEQLLIVETDFSAYHVNFIRDGVEGYFDRGEHCISYIDMSVIDLIELFGPSVKKRLVVIGILRTKEAVDYIIEAGIPLINLVKEAATEEKIALKCNLYFAGEGALVAKYFIEEMNLVHLGFVGYNSSIPHHYRRMEFTEASESRGIDVKVVEFPFSNVQQPFFTKGVEELVEHKGKIEAFLRNIQKPAGIFCGDDRIAFKLYYTAEAMGLKVPHEVAIIGVGSCNHSSIVKAPWTRAVSIVQIDHQKLGFTAAKMMETYVKTGVLPSHFVLSPNGIFHSQTTIRNTIFDPLVYKAFKLIQKDRNLDVVRISEKLNISRSSLDIRFYKSVNMTVTKAIEVERFNHAARLIREKKYSLEAVAGLSGYPNGRAMRRSFYRFTHMSPRQFRELHFLKPAAREK